MKNEVWHSIYIDDEITNYSVSNFGNIKNDDTGKILKPYKNHKKYLMVRLYHNKQPYDFSVHRLVALHFMPVRFSEQNQVNHIDGNKSNNKIDNLEWVTGTENINHAVQHNLINYHKGSEHHMAKYDEKTIRKICKLLSKGKSNKEISEKLNVSIGLVTDIHIRRAWTSISCDYDFPKLPRSKLFSDDLIIKICELLEKKCSHKEIKNELNLPDIPRYKDLISKIKGRKYYTDISKNYVW